MQIWSFIPNLHKTSSKSLSPSLPERNNGQAFAYIIEMQGDDAHRLLNIMIFENCMFHCLIPLFLSHCYHRCQGLQTFRLCLDENLAFLV